MTNVVLRQGSRSRIRIYGAASLALASFSAYTCVYAFRKPFTVAGFPGIGSGPVSFVGLLVIAQVVGYMLSKFSGITLVSGMQRSRRRWYAVGIVAAAWISLLLFAVVPWWAGIACFLVNGYLLGFMWGVIFSYVEGRRETDVTGTVMAVSFIFAGGFTRSVAIWMQQRTGLPDLWLPFAVGSVFLIPYLLCIFWLERLPPPVAEDVQDRRPREAMGMKDRRLVVRQIGRGLLMVTVAYVLLTVMRDTRDNFMSRMWQEFGYGNKPGILTQAETLISLVVLLAMSFFVLVRGNFRALQYLHLLILAGFLIVFLSSLLFIQRVIPGSYWMIWTGLGLYLAYIPFNCIFFERLIAAFQLRSNAGFLMYTTDAFGYLGSVAILLWKELGNPSIQWADFFAKHAITCGAVGMLAVFFSLLWFKRRYHDTYRVE